MRAGPAVHHVHSCCQVGCHVLAGGVIVEHLRAMTAATLVRGSCCKIEVMQAEGRTIEVCLGSTDNGVILPSSFPKATVH